MRHQIRFIDDDELPDGHDWMLVREEDHYYFFVKRSRVTQEVLMEGWAAYVELASDAKHLRSA